MLSQQQEHALRQEIAVLQKKHRARPEMMHGLRVPYTRRGVMAIPGFRMKGNGDVEIEGRAQSLRVMKKAAQLPVDFFFYDLEDAAPDNPAFKEYARQFVIEALTTIDFNDRVVAYRPNNIRTSYFEEDIVKVISQAGDRLHAMVIPKTEYADEVADILKIVRDVQRLSGHTNEIQLEVLIESPRSFLEAEKIAALDGVSALAFGSWDFARAVGGTVDVEDWLIDQAYIRQALPIIASAYGKDAVDAVTATLPLRPKAPSGVDDETYKAALSMASGAINVSVMGQDFVNAMSKKERALALVERDAKNARAVGYAAKWILHPDQIEAVQKAWTPSRDEALRALQLAASYTRAAHTGSGAEVDDDRLADKAVVATDWWFVKMGLRAGVLTASDIQDTGFALEELQRIVVTHESHLTLGESP